MYLKFYINNKYATVYNGNNKDIKNKVTQFVSEYARLTTPKQLKLLLND